MRTRGTSTTLAMISGKIFKIFHQNRFCVHANPAVFAMNLIKRVDLIFHLSLIVLLWHRPRWLFSDSIVFSWYHPLKSLSDLIVIALVKNIWYSRPIFHILSCVLPIFKMVGRLLNFYEVF